MKKNIIVTYSPRDETKKIFREVLGEVAHFDFLPEKDESDRIRLLEAADVVIALSFAEKEIHGSDISHFRNLRFIQLVFAGADNIPFDLIPEDVILASNVGAFADPIAEHVLGLVLALAKNLLPDYKKLAEGRFDRDSYNQELKGAVCAIIGFGGNGRAIARAMQAMGMQVFGINRSGTTDASIEFIGKESELGKALEIADVVVITTPLNWKTKNLIGVKQLEQMKADAILINVGRGEVINQKALYDHLKSRPGFRAGIDTWWSEPADRGRLALEYPFFELPNIIGSPHCADHVPRAIPKATRRALENVKRFLMGHEIRGVLDRGDYQ
jgi:glycerate dehydrogenase